VEDLDGDGQPEILVARSGSDSVSVLERAGERVFHLAGTFRAGDPRSLAVADLDGDGALDVVTADFLPGTLSVLLGSAVVRFQRGDTNGDGGVNLADAVFLLNSLFAGGPAPSCTKTGDTNDDGAVNIADPVFLLNHLFAGGPALDAPFEACGTDPTADELPCGSFPCP
jgi:hypothetical protein